MSNWFLDINVIIAISALGIKYLLTLGIKYNWD